MFSKGKTLEYSGDSFARFKLNLTQIINNNYIYDDSATWTYIGMFSSMCFACVKLMLNLSCKSYFVSVVFVAHSSWISFRISSVTSASFFLPHAFVPFTRPNFV